MEGAGCLSTEFPHWTIAQERNELFVIGKPLGILVFSITKALVARMVKRLPAMQETWVQSLGWEDSPGEGKGSPLQYSGLENPMDWIIHGVAKRWT